MLNSFILLLPCFVCCFWAIPLLLKQNRSKPQTILGMIAVLGSIYFFVDANYVTSGTNYRMLAVLDMAGQYTTLALFPMILKYMDSLTRRQRKPFFHTASVMPAFFMLGASLIIFAVLGLTKSGEYLAAFDAAGGHPAGYGDRIYLLRDFFSIFLYNLLMAAWSLFLIVSLIIFLVKNDFQIRDIRRFFLGKRESSWINIAAVLFITLLLICMVRIALGRQWLISHSVISCVLSATLAAVMLVTFYIGTWFEGRKVSFSAIRSPQDRSAESDTFLDYEIVPPQTSGDEGMPELKDRFESYITESKPYLDQNMTVETAAKALHTNRTYISKLMRDVYGMGFREYIGNLRMEEAKRMLLEKPEATLVYIATACGYSSDSQMIKKFNEILGESPRSWQKRRQTP